MSAILFGCLTYLQGRFFTTQATRELRAENSALQKHYAILNSQLKALDASLAGIRETETKVESKLFSEPVARATSKKTEYRIPSGIKEAQELLLTLKNKINESRQKAEWHNYQYAVSLHLTARDKSTVSAWPTGQPVSKTHLAVASGFGLRIHPFHKGVYQHQGIDFAAPKGTPVYCTGAGKVVDTGKSNLEAGYGNYVEIDHGNGIITRYAHLHEVAVKPGQAIEKGEVIGSVGMSGGASAPHLHYEIMRDGEQVNPMLFMMDGLTSREFTRLAAQAEKRNQSLD
jgi:murein DD-endopeptidase MepM/ murein hydrolase activator NlpD